MLAEVEATPFPDWRLNKRLNLMLENLSQAPEQSIPQAMGNWLDTKAAYEFLDNDRVSHRALVAGQGQITRERIRHRISQGDTVVLCVQDTTDFNFKHHPATHGMGPLENKHMSGFLAHSNLAVSSQGVPLGLLEQEVWVRDAAETGKSKQRHQRRFEEKESYKWVKGLPCVMSPPEQETSLAQLDIQWVTVCDREAHIYEFMDEVLKQEQAFIVRASRGRSFSPDGQELFGVVQQMSVQQVYRLTLPRHPQRQEREAQVELRYGQVTLRRPQRSSAEAETITVQVVEVLETQPPAGEKAVHWVLLTSLPVENLEEAQQIILWYSYRWLLERFHYVLKSGCRLEERQLREQKRLERLLGVFNLIAWQLLWLTYQARQTPNASCLEALEPHQWQALYAHTHQTMDVPTTPPTLGEAVHWIARLGGFLGRKGDGEPGVKVLWRGLTRLRDISATWLLFHPPPKDSGNV